MRSKENKEKLTKAIKNFIEAENEMLKMAGENELNNKQLQKLLEYWYNRIGGNIK